MFVKYEIYIKCLLKIIHTSLIIQVVKDPKNYYGRKQMKIAIVTDDGKTISRHFGRAQYYLVVEFEAGNEAARSLREKAGHHSFSQAEQIQEHKTGEHGFDTASQSRHAQMLEVINDCQVVIAGGMGRGAYHSMTESGKEVFVVSFRDIDQALNAYLTGVLENISNLIH